MNSSSLPRQNGLSLIEIMVALTLGLILTAGLVQIFVSNQQSFSLTAASGRVQESGRMAAELLSKAVRSADYWGCAGSRGNVVNNLNPSGSGYSDEVFGFSDGLDGLDDADGSGLELTGTDSFTIRGVGGGADIKIDQVMAQASAVLHVNDSTTLDPDDIVFITDCRGGDIFQVTNVNNNGTVVHNTGNSSPGNFNPSNPGCPGSNSHCLSKVYDEGASIYIPYFEQYYIATGASGAPALFMRSGDYDAASGGVGNVQTVELIEGIENMQVLYGEDINNDLTAEVWRDADAVSDMGAVVALRISLLSRSEDDAVAPDQPDVTFGGINYANDGRLRRVYTFTSSIRNRIGG